MSEDAAAINPMEWEIHTTHPDMVPSLCETLAEVVDPEIGLTVIQLSLARKVSVEADSLKMYVLLTTPFCPCGPTMLEMIKNKAQEGSGNAGDNRIGLRALGFFYDGRSQRD